MRKNLLIIFLILCCSIPLQTVLAQASVEVGVFQPITTSPDSRIEVPIEVRGVQDLYAVDLELQFDPAVLTAEDADPNMIGVQAALGTFLDAGLLLFNTIDPETGVVRFVMTQMNPSEPKSGEGILLVLYLSGNTAGEGDLIVNSVTLSDRFGVEIPASVKESLITIEESAPALPPANIPVQDPTNIIIIPTLAPTPTPTKTLVPTQTPTATQTPVPKAEDKPAIQPTETTFLPSVTGGEQEESGFSLRQNWWIILLAALVTAGLGVYLFIQRKQPPVDDKSERNPPLDSASK